MTYKIKPMIPHSTQLEQLLHQIHITCESLEILQKQSDGALLSLSHHEGTLRDTYPHFMNQLGSLMLEPAIKAGFRIPSAGFALGNIAQYTEYLAAQAETGYLVRVKNLKMTVPQIEAAKDSLTEIGKANIDLAAAMWGGSANPFATAWADTMKHTIDTQQEIFDASRTITAAEYDLSQFAAEMVHWSEGVERWLHLIKS